MWFSLCKASLCLFLCPPYFGSALQTSACMLVPWVDCLVPWLTIHHFALQCGWELPCQVGSCFTLDNEIASKLWVNNERLVRRIINTFHQCWHLKGMEEMSSKCCKGQRSDYEKRACALPAGNWHQFMEDFTQFIWLAKMSPCCIANLAVEEAAGLHTVPCTHRFRFSSLCYLYDPWMWGWTSQKKQS